MLEKVVKHYVKDYAGEEKICCPFHMERTPSLVLYHHQASFYCYGCGASGSPLDFVAYAEDLDIKEDFKKVKELAMGIMGKTYEQYVKEKAELSDGVEVMQIDCLPSMTDEEVKAFIAASHIVLNNGTKVHAYQGMGYRNIKDEYLRFFGHVTRKDKDGNVLSRHYPETNTKGKMAGYKCRNHPKDFTHGNVGHTGSKNQLSGQARYQGFNKYLLIVGGEEDKVAAYQMLEENRAGKPQVAEVHVVSPTCGENTCAKQVALNRDFCDRYENIIIGMDNDDAGKKAAQAIAEVLPKEKVKIAVWSGKDPNKMLDDGKHQQFCRDFYNARPLIASGIKESSGLMDSVREELMRPRIKLPPHWHEIERATKGGFLQGRIINIIGDTSVGKTTHINDLVYYWMFHAPEKVGVVSLEMTDGQYTIDLLSLHLEKNLMWIGDGEDILNYLDRPEIKALYDDLLTHDDGRPRFSILDERDGDIKMLEKQIETLIHQHGCKIIVVDVLTDILRGMDMSAQEEHMKFQKRIVKSGVTIINVLHTRKPAGSGEGWKMPTEYDAFGSSTFVQSAAVNIVIGRDKMSEDSIEKNRTYVDMPKCRGGETGSITSFIYDVVTRKVMDYNDWIARQASSRSAIPDRVVNDDVQHVPQEYMNVQQEQVVLDDMPQVVYDSPPDSAYDDVPF
ncbi:helicase [Pseudomonas phage vB_PpS_SYP]|nr:helicase [Pseudomonas phage vB_PpS_SYP]